MVNGYLAKVMRFLQKWFKDLSHKRGKNSAELKSFQDIKLH